MDFFDRQDQARRNTKKLVVYFVLAVACIIAAVYLACVLIFAGAAGYHHQGRAVELALWNSDIFFYSAMGTLAVIVCGSAYQISALSGGGSVVAESLGGRLIEPGSAKPLERKLLNIVEEMSIASGVPMPKVYVMDGESGINAFAAGHAPSDAAVAVTRGCIETLNRDELQGVIGHEFSHILNGDMRLNLRLMGIIFGIICLATIGRILLRTRGRKNPLPLLGLALIVIGGLGVFFGRLIQAAVSRQREFLADASSVQFTRNPGGLSHALQKIGAVGSKMESEHAADACHMFFGNGMSSSLFEAFATHPPLEARIRAIDPTWDGKFPKAAAIEANEESRKLKAETGSEFQLSQFQLSAFAGRRPAATVVRAQTVLPSLGQPTPLHLRYAEEMRNSFPENITAATRDPAGAAALIYALLLSEDETMRASQLDGLAKQGGENIRARVVALLPDVTPIATRVRLPLVNLVVPALRQMPPREYPEFTRTLKWLVESDGQIDLFEFVLQKILQRNLAAHFTPRRPPVAQFYTLKPLLPDAAMLFSALANTSSADDAEVAKAFQTGAPYLRAQEGGLTLLPREQCGLAQIDAALNRLALAVPQIKRNLLEASVRIVGADGVIQEREAELLRAIADSLDCPIPPFVETEDNSETQQT
ncbi:MAG: Zn-dependent protease with chaperone function [Pedosphaera sp.]|nr:Zn-dependent protease with chaperone function [Pedosphaera sp.]